MHNSNIPTETELPSTKKLVKSTIIAAIAAGVLLVTIVMPAEYGIDPTGLGKVTGLKKMGEIKMSLAKEAEQEKVLAERGNEEVANLANLENQTSVENEAYSQRTDEMQVTLAPNEGTEIKVTLKKGDKVNFKWFSSGGKANYDIHGDSKELNIDYHGYGKGSKVTDAGVIEAAFDGSHGWFWRNRTNEAITITLQTIGDYTDIKHIK